MTQDLSLSIPFPADPESRPHLRLMGGMDASGLDSLIPGGVYAMVPQSPPARYPLWATLLQSAIAAGQVCHVLLRTDPPDFLDRLRRSGWPDVEEAWKSDSLRIYPMADGFSKLLFRRDVPGLTSEFQHWGITTGDFILVDAGDELLSLHDLFLATGQLVKLRAWARDEKIPMLLNFALAGAMTGQRSLTGLMDHFSGLARLHSDTEGPVLTLEYWQGLLGTVAERTVPLVSVAGAFQLRPAHAEADDNGRTSRSSIEGGQLRQDSNGSPPIAEEMRQRRATDSPAEGAGHFTNDEVWARELQLLTGNQWQTLPDTAAMLESAQAWGMSHAVLRFAPQTQLVDLARTIHALRTALRTRIRITVAEHRMSLRYANELMLMRLGADAIIRQDVPLQQWPGMLRRLNAQAPRAFESLDVEQALESVAASHEKGYLPLPHFLAEVQSTVSKAHVLGVPFAMAVLGQPQDTVIRDALQLVQMRRCGDLLTTDGHQIFVFFYACSLTMGPRVLAHAFEQVQGFDLVHVDWMASESDIQGLIQTLSSTQLSKELQPPPEADFTPGIATDEPVVSDAVTALEPADPPGETEPTADDPPPEPKAGDVDAPAAMSVTNDATPDQITDALLPDSSEVRSTDGVAGVFDGDSPADAGAEQPLSADDPESPMAAVETPGEPPDLSESPPASGQTNSLTPPKSRPGKVLAQRVSEVVPHVPRSTANPAGFERRRTDQKEAFHVERRVADLIRRLARPAEGSSRKPSDSRTREPR